MSHLTSEQLKAISDDLERRYIIVPRWSVRVWGAAIITILAALGITSYLSFSKAVSAIAATAATSVAETTARNIAEAKAAIAVETVFHEAIDQSKKVATRIAQSTVAIEVVPVVEQAAKSAVELEVRKKLTDPLGQDVIAEMHRRNQETIYLSQQIASTWEQVQSATLLDEINFIQQNIDDLKKNYSDRTKHVRAQLRPTAGTTTWKSPGGIAAMPLDKTIEINLDRPSIVLLTVSGTVRHASGHKRLHIGFLDITSHMIDKNILPSPLDPIGYYRELGGSHHEDEGRWRPFSLTQAISLPAGSRTISVGPLRSNNGSWEFHYVRVDATVFPLAASETTGIQASTDRGAIR